MGAWHSSDDGEVAAVSQGQAPFPLYECQDLKNRTRICIIGSTSFQDDTSKVLVEALAAELDVALGPRAAFVTGGMSGVQETFAKSCGDGARVWNVLPVGEASNFQAGHDVHAGADIQERNEILAKFTDIYISVEGGPGVSEEARLAIDRGVPVIPMMRTGGASSGLFGFPAEALQCPAFINDDKWNLLKSNECWVETSVAVAVTVVTGFVACHEMKLQCESINDTTPADKDSGVTQSDADHLQKRNADLEEQFEAMSKSKAADVKTIEELIQQAEVYRAQVDELRQRLEETELSKAERDQAAMAQANQEIETLRKELVLVKEAGAADLNLRSSEEYDREHNQTKQYLAEAMEHLADKERQIEAHQLALITAEQELVAFKDSHVHLEQELASYKDAYEQLQTTYNQVSGAYLELQKNQETLLDQQPLEPQIQQELEDLYRRLEEEQAARAEAENTVVQLQARLEAAPPSSASNNQSATVPAVKVLTTYPSVVKSASVNVPPASKLSPKVAPAEKPSMQPTLSLNVKRPQATSTPGVPVVQQPSVTVRSAAPVVRSQPISVASPPVSSQVIRGTRGSSPLRQVRIIR